LSKHNVIEFESRVIQQDPLSEMLRVESRQLIHQAVEAELQELLEKKLSRMPFD